MKSIFSSFFRLSSALFRFIFIVWINSEFDLGVSGYLLYILIFVDFFVYVVGFDIYTFLNKKRVLIGLSGRDNLIYFKFHVISLLFLFFISSIIFYCFENFFQDVKLLHFFLIILELFLIEYYRFNISVGKNLLGSVFFFVKQNGWCFILFLAVNYLKVDIDKFDQVWFVFNFLILLFIVFNDRRFYKAALKVRFNFNFFYFFKLTFFASLGMYISALCTRGIFYIDKKFIANFSLDGLAIYGFYFMIASIVMTLIESIVVPRILPSILKTNGDLKNNLKILKDFLMSVNIIFFICLFFIFIFIEKILNVIGKDAFLDNLSIMYILLFAFWFRANLVALQYFFYGMNVNKKVGFIGAMPLILYVSICNFYNPASIEDFSIMMLCAWAIPSFIAIGIFLFESGIKK